MTKGVFSPQPLTPGRQTRRRRVHHLIRNRTAESMARNGACSQSGGGRAAGSCPSCPVDEPCCGVVSRAISGQRGHTLALGGGHLCPQGCSVRAPSPPPRCPNSTSAGVPRPLCPKCPGLCLRVTPCTCICPGQKNVPGFHSGSRRGAHLHCRLFCAREGPSTCRTVGPGEGAQGPAASAWRVPTLETGAQLHGHTHT